MYDTILIGNNQINKHEKYKNQYLKNNIYWGLGIENEVYLEFENKRSINKDDFISNHKRERYSVDYFSNYKKKDVEDAFKYIYSIIDDNIEIPVMLNSNSFTKTDFYNNSKTLYTKNSELNPKFNGNTLIETLEIDNIFFNSTYENNWIFDGDTIEFINTKFYNVKLEDVIKELDSSKTEFVNNLNDSFQRLNIYSDYGIIKIMEYNNPFSIYMTNLNNIGMFNNGTLHYNLTLPSKLNEEGVIEDKVKFIKDHSKAIKIIQWVEPLIISVYGSPDPFSLLNEYYHKNKFSKSSQRCAISRYIGIGTYNSDNMPCGKILSIPIKDVICNNYEYWWFNKYYEDNSYTKLNDIGLDINFNKHYNHGIEIRFLDHINDSKKIYESFEFIIYLMDYVLESDHINNFGNPIINKIWNNIVLNIMKFGKEYNFNKDEKDLYEKIFKCKLKSINVVDIYYELYCKLVIKYNSIYKSQDNKNNYILKPSGLFSLLTLSIDSNKSINNDILDNCESNKKQLIINNNLNKNYDSKYIEKFYSPFSDVINEIKYMNKDLSIDELHIDIVNDITIDHHREISNKLKCLPLNNNKYCIIS
jgi:hypothetical protein